MFVKTGNVNTMANIQNTNGMEKGYVGLWRKIRDWEWYTDLNTKSLFIHLLLSVNHTDKKWRGQLIKRGQLITSYGKLANEIGMGVQEVRTSLDKLILTNDITKVSTNKNTMITLVNYGVYQDLGGDSNTRTNKRNNKRVTHEQQTTNKQLTTTKELKELEKLKELKERGNALNFLKTNYPEEFKMFVTEYKNKIGDLKKFELNFNAKVVLENIPFESDKLLARLGAFTRNWIEIENKNKNKDEGGRVDEMYRRMPSI